jgi:hypothetical protein
MWLPLDDLKAVSSQYMPELATIAVRTEASDGAGGTTESWANVATNVPCRIVRRQVADTTAGGARAIRSVIEIACAFGTALAVGQRVTVGGTAYYVRSVSPDSWSVAARAEVALSQ